MGEKVVILGAGPVGWAVGQRFLQQRVPVRFVTKSGRSGPSGSESWQADLRESDAVKRAAEGASVLVHAAGVPYQDWVRDLPKIQSAVIEAAQTSGAVTVFVENLYSYQPRFPLCEATPEVPPSRKGALRLRLSSQWQDAHRSGTIRGVGVRGSDYWGPGATRSSNSAFGARFFPGLESGRPVAFVGNPQALHSYTYLPDFARALAEVAQKPDLWGRSWIAPCLEPMSPHAIANRFAALAGCQVAVKAFSRTTLRLVGLFSPVVRELGEMLYQFEDDFIADSTALESQLGWRATPLDQALRETWDDHLRTSAPREL